MSCSPLFVNLANICMYKHIHFNIYNVKFICTLYFQYLSSPIESAKTEYSRLVADPWCDNLRVYSLIQSFSDTCYNSFFLHTFICKRLSHTIPHKITRLISTEDPNLTKTIPPNSSWKWTYCNILTFILISGESFRFVK